MLVYLQGKCRREAVRGSVQDSQRGLQHLFDGGPGQDTVLCSEDTQQTQIHKERPEDGAVPQGHRPGRGVLAHTHKEED